MQFVVNAALLHVDEFLPLSPIANLGEAVAISKDYHLKTYKNQNPKMVNKTGNFNSQRLD